MEQQQQPVERTPHQLFQCTQCSKSYKRPEHLQRHVAVHKGTREYRCAKCASTFQRSDVLARHAKACNGQRSRRPSVNRRACDTCIKGKRACSFTPPCLNCRKRGIDCTFAVACVRQSARPDTSGAADGMNTSLAVEIGPSASTDVSANWITMADEDLWSKLLDISWRDLIVDDLDWSMLMADTERERLTLRFLESFTRNTGFLDSFDCLTFEERIGAYNTYISRSTRDVPADNLLPKSQEIITLIRETVRVKQRNSPVSLEWDSGLEALCIDFFSPQHIRLRLELYWAIWHPNVNYMHRPTFDASTSKPSLVAAMAIIGALVSPDETDRDNARIWMNCVEEMVFQDDDVCYDGERSPFFPTIQRLQAMQSMYLVCLFQNWEGDQAARSRIRRFRYGTVVAVARDIGIGHARHPSYELLDPSEFSWHDFVAREQLIRVLMWVFLLDTAFVIFNNVPPRMAIKEMKMQLACSEASFQAPTEDTCQQYLKAEATTGKHTLSSITRFMCKDSIPLETQVALADIGPLNMFALTSGTLRQLAKLDIMANDH